MYISLQSESLRYIMLSGEELELFITKEWYEKYNEDSIVFGTRGSINENVWFPNCTRRITSSVLS